MFLRRRRMTLLHPGRDVRETVALATDRAGGRATDSLDLLAAATETKAVARLLAARGVQKQAVLDATVATRTDAGPPGLADDARRVMDTMMRRSVERRREPSIVDLLVALATTDSPARSALRALGIVESDIVSRFE